MTVDATDHAGDIDEFARLKADEDPRTIEEMIADDEYEDVVLTEVRPPSEPGGYWSVQWGSVGTGLKPPEGVELKVGDTVRMYGGAQLGGSRHGWALNGELVEWQTPWERFAARVKWLAGYDRDKRERFAGQREELDAKYEALSSPMKARIARRADFRVDAEAYEMVACVDGDKIAAALRPRVEAGEDPQAVVKEFYDLPWDEQNTLVPGLDQGHSGNTFGGACSLARALLAGESV
jgi:hypothetical protein